MQQWLIDYSVRMLIRKATRVRPGACHKQVDEARERVGADNAALAKALIESKARRAAARGFLTAAIPGRLVRLPFAAGERRAHTRLKAELAASIGQIAIPDYFEREGWETELMGALSNHSSDWNGEVYSDVERATWVLGFIARGSVNRRVRDMLCDVSIRATSSDKGGIGAALRKVAVRSSVCAAYNYTEVRLLGKNAMRRYLL